MGLMTITWILPPLGVPIVITPTEQVGLVVYLCVDAMIAWIASRHREALLERQRSDHLIAERDAQLKELSEELRRTLDTADIGLTHCSRELRYLSANAAYAKLIGLPVEKIVGRSVVEVVGTAAFEVMRPHIETVLSGARVEYDADAPRIARLGATRWATGKEYRSAGPYQRSGPSALP
jgi:PAS domain-containing protein